MKVNHTDDINYNRSCYRLLILTWICIVVVLFSDTLTVFIDAQFLSNTIFSSAFVTYVILPGFLNVLVMAVVNALSYFFLRKKMYVAQACLYIVGITIICYIMARNNLDVSLNMMFFIVPIVLSMFYLDKRLLLFSFIISSIAFAIHLLLMLNKTDSGLVYAMLPINIEISIVIMVIVLVAGMVIIDRSETMLKKAEESAIKKDEDILTGYLNHSGFYNDLDQTFMKFGKEKGEFSLALLDIDNFTHINEEYSYKFGDKVLETIVSSINKSLVNTATAYRYGGEEFVIICKGPEEIVINMVDSILRDFKNKTEMKLDVAVTASAGICGYDPKMFRGKRDLFAALDEALYAAKRLGKNQYVVWNEAVVRDSFASVGNDIARM